MIYTKLTMEAMRIAYQAHHGQVDKGGIPYVLHPVHLAEQMTDEYSTCAALLHDVVEDTDVTLDALAQIFPAAVMDALALLTHKESEPYEAYVERLKHNPIARAVKLADLHHNSDQSRIPDAGPGVLAYFNAKYKAAFDILLNP